MTNFHATIRDLLEDTNRFLSFTLQNETLSSPASTHREKLLSQLLKFQNQYPELHLQFDPSGETKFSSSSSPLPYVDMNGGRKSHLCPSNVDKENYDITKERNDGLEDQSIADSEDYASDEAKVLPDMAASELYACEKAGYLDKKKRESIKGWLNPFQRRWCAIKEGVLYYYEKTSDRKQRGSILLAGYEVRVVHEDYKDGKRYNHCFELVCPGKRTYQFSAASETDLLQWIAAVERNNVSPGKPSSRESQYDPPKAAEVHVAEDIYEIVDQLEESVSVKSDASTVLAFEDYSEWYVGLWNCSAADDSELTFCRGDLIHVLNKELDSYSWWIGELQGKVGFVPKSYLMEAYE